MWTLVDCRVSRYVRDREEQRYLKEMNYASQKLLSVSTSGSTSQLTGLLLFPSHKECLFVPQPFNTSFYLRLILHAKSRCALACVLTSCCSLLFIPKQEGKTCSRCLILHFSESASEWFEHGTRATQGIYGVVEVVLLGAASHFCGVTHGHCLDALVACFRDTAGVGRTNKQFDSRMPCLWHSQEGGRSTNAVLEASSSQSVDI